MYTFHVDPNKRRTSFAFEEEKCAFKCHVKRLEGDFWWSDSSRSKWNRPWLQPDTGRAPWLMACAHYESLNGIRLLISMMTGERMDLRLITHEESNKGASAVPR